ncbi:MAG: DUF2271 domain-containing protein [Acidobacteria bacterium]|nr:DUF2271 domain-containing protein [Acidobacteriota bacterium]
MHTRRSWTHRGLASGMAILAGVILLLGCAVHAQVVPAAQAPAPPAASDVGRLEVAFLYMPPTTIDPTYHTAIWLEDDKGVLVKTLYVSQELSSTEYKMGNVCPDWVKKAQWDKAPKSEVDAVTAPTPNVGSEAKVFDLAALGLAAGVYQFRFQMHVAEDHNVLYRATLTVGPADSKLTLEMTQGPGKLLSTDAYVKDVQVRYLAPAK